MKYCKQKCNAKRIKVTKDKGQKRKYFINMKYHNRWNFT